jgi:ABC-2 type transport system permease protein
MTMTMTTRTFSPEVLPERSRLARTSDLLAAEWLKLRTVRSSYLAVLAAAAVALFIAIGLAQANVAGLRSHGALGNLAGGLGSRRPAGRPGRGLLPRRRRPDRTGIGAIIRHTAGAITVIAAFLYLVPEIGYALPFPWNWDFANVFPSTAAQQTTQIAISPHSHALAAGPSYALLFGYAILIPAAAAWLIRRRDA